MSADIFLFLFFSLCLSVYLSLFFFLLFLFFVQRDDWDGITFYLLFGTFT